MWQNEIRTEQELILKNVQMDIQMHSCNSDSRIHGNDHYTNNSLNTQHRKLITDEQGYLKDKRDYYNYILLQKKTCNITSTKRDNYY